MIARKSLSQRHLRLLVAAMICLPASLAQADHEVSYFPSFYPQEIRIEQLDPDAAARAFASKTDPLHVYLGVAPRFAGAPTPHVKSIKSLKALIVAAVNPQSALSQNREARCRAIATASRALSQQPDIIVRRYPITPYHADYIYHADLASQPDTSGAPATAVSTLTLRAPLGGSESLLAQDARVDATAWDVDLFEVSTDALMRLAGAGFNAWPAPPWMKEGWFQAYHLLRPSISDAQYGNRADMIFDRLTHGEFKDLTEQINLERDLLAALGWTCERAVIGYRLRTEFYNDDFSNGIENITVDSQTGFNSPVFVRTVKLKDFLWNGWLRLGIGESPTSAWNPIAGFTDPVGRLIWATAADSAFLPTPHNSRWIANRTEIQAGEDTGARRSVRMPADALLPQPGTGRLVSVGEGRGATATVRYRVVASPYQDETAADLADLLYPYSLAFRWGTHDDKEATFDPDIAAATQLLRERLRGIKLVKVEETSLRVANLAFTRRVHIVDVYLDDLSADQQDSAVIAPPWSAMPWHVLALMEVAVERGIAAFSESEATRRRLPWLDLVRDPEQLEKLRGLIREFIASSYRPAALEKLVDPQTAQARWQLLDKFVAEKGHLLVTNGPYRLKSWSPSSASFDVVRDFTYPIGLGTFDAYAYPPRALITDLAQKDSRIIVNADVEIALKEQRDRRLVRVPLQRDTLRGMLPIRSTSTYIVVDADGRVAISGHAARLPDGRFTLALPQFPPGRYSVFIAIFPDGNTIEPHIRHLTFTSN